MATFIKVFAMRTTGGQKDLISINTDQISYVTGNGPEYKIILKREAVLPGYSSSGITITIPKDDKGKMVQLGLL